jgi:hypothetical protein
MLEFEDGLLQYAYNLGTIEGMTEYYMPNDLWLCWLFNNEIEMIEVEEEKNDTLV